MSDYSYSSVIRSFHVYRNIWTPNEGEELTTKRENDNLFDKYAISVLKDNIVVGHVPKEISKLVAFFIKHGGVLKCIVTEGGVYRHSEEAGGLEIPCVMVFSGPTDLVERLKSLL